MHINWCKNFKIEFLSNFLSLNRKYHCNYCFHTIRFSSPRLVYIFQHFFRSTLHFIYFLYYCYQIKYSDCLRNLDNNKIKLLDLATVATYFSMHRLFIQNILISWTFVRSKIDFDDLFKKRTNEFSNLEI